MRSRMASACSPASAISPPLHKPILRSSSLASRVLADGDELVAVASAAGRSRSDRPAGSRAPRPPRRRASARAQVASASAARISGVSPNMTRISSAPARDAPCVPPAPHARCRAVRAARKSAPSARTRCASLRDRVVIGPDHHRDVAAARLRPPPSSTCASSVRPPIACSTFGRRERMRVPSPAASTIARQERCFIRVRLAFGPGGRRAP